MKGLVDEGRLILPEVHMNIIWIYAILSDLINAFGLQSIGFTHFYSSYAACCVSSYLVIPAAEFGPYSPPHPALL